MASIVETDFLSNLPKDIKERILIYLPIKETGRTSILSSKWRYIWASITEIVITDDETISDLVNFVDAIFLLHSGSIRKFNLSALQHCPEAFDRWVVNLSRNGIRELILNFCVDRYMMHSSFFSCDELNSINLNNCTFRVPDEFKGFKFLHTLELTDLKISEGEIEKWISSCPLLENLKLSFLSNPENRSIIIHAPNLRSLKIRGTFIDLHLYAPRLLLLCVQLHKVIQYLENINNRFPCINFGQILSNLPNLESLELGGYFSEHLRVVPLKDVFPFTFNYLKYLHLDLELEDEKEAAFVLALFQGAPHLQSIHVDAYSDERPTVKFWETIHRKEDMFNHLKDVKIVDFRRAEAKFSFVKFILDSARELETLIIKEDPNFKENDGTIILKQLLALRRASAKAQIFFE